MPLRPGPPRTDLYPAAHCLIRSLFKKKELEDKGTLKTKELKYAIPLCFLARGAQYDSTQKFKNS